MAKCAYCSTENNEDAKYCQNCGASLQSFTQKQIQARLTDNDGKVYPLEGLKASIGAGTTRDISVRGPGVNDLHAELQYNGADWVLYRYTDGDVLINDQPVASYHFLRNGDRIKIGYTVLQFSCRQGSTTPNQPRNMQGEIGALISNLPNASQPLDPQRFSQPEAPIPPVNVPTYTVPPPAYPSNSNPPSYFPTGTSNPPPYPTGGSNPPGEDLYNRERSGGWLTPPPPAASYTSADRCVSCGAQMPPNSIYCPSCYAAQPTRTSPGPSSYNPPVGVSTGKSKDRKTAGILALLLGGLGVHKFYLGQIWMGVLYLLFVWTYIPAIIGIIEGIMYLNMSDYDFEQKYVNKL